MIYGRAYFKGEVIAEVTDIGFDTVDDVISALANQLPNDIPIGCNVQFRLTNCDSQKKQYMSEAKARDSKFEHIGKSAHLFQNRTISHIGAVLSICPVDSRAILHGL